MQPSSPTIEAKMKRLSTATMTLSLVQWQAGRKVSQTLQNISMLNGQELGFIKVVRQVPDQERHSEAAQGQGSQVFQDTVQGSD